MNGGKDAGPYRVASNDGEEDDDTISIQKRISIVQKLVDVLGELGGRIG